LCTDRFQDLQFSFPGQAFPVFDISRFVFFKRVEFYRDFFHDEFSIDNNVIKTYIKMLF